VQIRIGAPLDLTRWEGSGSDPRAWRAATDELMVAIQRLTGQECVGRHANDVNPADRDVA